jgi:hypothetical protein
VRSQNTQKSEHIDLLRRPRKGICSRETRTILISAEEEGINGSRWRRSPAACPSYECSGSGGKGDLRTSEGRRSGDMRTACHAVTRGLVSAVRPASNARKDSKAKMLPGRSKKTKSWRRRRGPKCPRSCALRAPSAAGTSEERRRPQEPGTSAAARAGTSAATGRGRAPPQARDERRCEPGMSAISSQVPFLL